MSPEAPALHALTWTVWMVAAAVAVQTATNPLYVTLVVLACWLVVEVHGRDSAMARAFPVMVGLAAFFGLVRVVVTTLTTHTGLHVLVTLPSVTVPDWLGGFTVGGTIERTALLQSLAEAWAVVGFVAVFAAWNAVVSHHEVLRAVPRAFHEPALVVTIAVAFVPSTIAALRAVQLGDRARCGGTPRRRGRLRRLVVPVFEGGLERAIALAESMDSRGLGHQRATAAERRTGRVTLFALLTTAGALVAMISRARVAAAVLAVTGIAAFAVAVVLASRAEARTRYRPRPIRRRDLVQAAVAVVAVGGVVLASLADDATLHWSADPLAAPSASLLVVTALMLLGAPAVETAWRR
jgi:energy-coupling factor transport system permease protein